MGERRRDRLAEPDRVRVERAQVGAEQLDARRGRELDDRRCRSGRRRSRGGGARMPRPGVRADRSRSPASGCCPGWPRRRRRACPLPRRPSAARGSPPTDRPCATRRRARRPRAAAAIDPLKLSGASTTLRRWTAHGSYAGDGRCAVAQHDRERQGSGVGIPLLVDGGAQGEVADVIERDVDRRQARGDIATRGDVVEAAQRDVGPDRRGPPRARPTSPRSRRRR